MDLSWFCWQRYKVSIRHVCWRLSFIAAALLACAQFTSDFFLCCAFQITQFPNIKIGNVALLHSDRVFSAQKEACARLTELMKDKGQGSCCQSCFPKSYGGEGACFGKHGRASMQSSGTTPRSSAGCPQLHPHLHHHAGTWLQQHQPCCVISPAGDPFMPEREDKGDPETENSLSCLPSPLPAIPCGSTPQSVHCSQASIAKAEQQVESQAWLQAKEKTSQASATSDSTSPAGNAECPVEVPGAELSRSALNKGQGHCQRILRNVINTVLIPGTVSARPVLNG